jgi:orotate phosphoribosyltransferase/AMMECR1 domain-containing protein
MLVTAADLAPTRFTPDDREQLRARLCRDGFLRQEDGVRLSGIDGSARAWMLYTWGVSATGSGSRLIARALLDQLTEFRAGHLAAYGVTAAPLLSACVVLDDRYAALAVRAKPKGHGAGWRVDGDRGPDGVGRRVVVVDDSLSSGRSFLTAAGILEAEGFEVEGLVALVEFPGRGGRQRLEALGYRVGTVFDVWTDLEAPGPPPVRPREAIDVTWSDERVPDGLHPADAARRVLEHLASTGTTPQPPRELGADVDGRGGVFVSIRRREDDRRLARGGFWHFDAGDADPPRDLVLAVTATASRLGATVTTELLDQVKIAVSFLGPLTPTTAADLDFGRYGVVVRSRAWTAKLGGALPNTQYFTSTFEQYLHARWTNAQVEEIEPHDVFRHTVAKYVEPGTT